MISTPRGTLSVSNLYGNVQHIGFFFRVTNTRKDQPVKFNLLNHTKPDSLFNFGMKVLIYSEQQNKVDGTGWHRDGRDIAYF
jgi:hypothetical protein